MKPETSRKLTEIKNKIIKYENGVILWYEFIIENMDLDDNKLISMANKLLNDLQN